ncbi:MAG: universal stress protein [Ilumatobacteraceae bacterium]
MGDDHAHVRRGPRRLRRLAEPRDAVAWAAAEAVQRGARLEVVSCYEVPWIGKPPVTVERVRDIESGTDAELDVLVAALAREHPGLEVTGDTIAGRPRHVLRDAGERADLVVVGAGHDGSERFLRSGATARFVGRHSAAPVAIVPTTVDGHRVERIVVGVDGDGADGPALRWAADEAERRGVELVVVHADPACRDQRPQRRRSRHRRGAHRPRHHRALRGSRRAIRHRRCWRRPTAPR